MLEGGMKPEIPLYGFPNTSLKSGTKPPGIYILIPISGDSDAQSGSAR